MSRVSGWLAVVASGVAAASAAASPPPAVTAPAWLVENGSGEVLAASHARDARAIASITKLMTVLVVLDHHALGDLVTIDSRSSSVGQESIALRPGEQLTIADLIRGALIQSANDAAVALALATSPNLTGFANLMNAKAAELGLHHTHFVRPDGLDAPGAYSSAADVTRLAREAMRRSFVRSTVQQRTASIAGGRMLHTWNDLLGVVPGIVGVKTGHTDEAGWSEVAADVRGPTTIYATILGSPTREQRNADLGRLIAWGFSQYVVVDAIAAGRAYAEVDLPYGRGRLALVPRSALRATVRPGRPLTERVVAPRFTGLPVRQGQVLGHVEVWAGPDLLGRRALVASRSVGRPGFGGRAEWYVGRTIHHIGGIFT